MRTLHRSTGAMLLVAVMLIAALGPAAATAAPSNVSPDATPISSCTTIESSGEYVLSSDVSDAPENGVSRRHRRRRHRRRKRVRDHVERGRRTRAGDPRDGRRERLGEERESLRLAGRRGVRRRRARIRDQRACHDRRNRRDHDRGARRRTSQSPTTACGTGPTECGSRRPAMSPFATTRSAV